MRRIGVAFPGGDPASPATWSGTPAGLIEGLTEIGCEPVPLRVGAPKLVRAAVTNVVAVAYLRPGRNARAIVRAGRGAARATPLMSRVDTAFTPVLGEHEPLDGIVQIGTGVTLRSRVPIATYEDMTVAQNRDRPYEAYALLSKRAIEARVERQRTAYHMAAACCTTTDWVAASIERDYSIDPDKVRVVGIGHRSMPSSAERDWATPRFLFVGADWGRKNGQRVLEAFAHIRRDIPTARLDVVGQHPEIDQVGVTGYGVLRRDVPDERRLVEQLFGDATCFVMPSLLEAAGIVYLEAASAGIPSIGTDVGGAGDVIGDGGVVVDPTSDAQLESALRRFADPATARAVGATGRDRARDFTWSRVAERIVGALSEGGRTDG